MRSGTTTRSMKIPLFRSRYHPLHPVEGEKVHYSKEFLIPGWQRVGETWHPLLCWFLAFS
jgi:hypothetical protein